MTDSSKLVANDLSQLSIQELQGRRSMMQVIVIAFIAIEVVVVSAGAYLYLSPTMRLSSVALASLVPLVIMPTLFIVWGAGRVKALSAELARRSS